MKAGADRLPKIGALGRIAEERAPAYIISVSNRLYRSGEHADCKFDRGKPFVDIGSRRCAGSVCLGRVDRYSRQGKVLSEGTQTAASSGAH